MVGRNHTIRDREVPRVDNLRVSGINRSDSLVPPESHVDRAHLIIVIIHELVEPVRLKVGLQHSLRLQLLLLKEDIIFLLAKSNLLLTVMGAGLPFRGLSLAMGQLIFQGSFVGF